MLRRPALVFLSLFVCSLQAATSLDFNRYLTRFNLSPVAYNITGLMRGRISQLKLSNQKTIQFRNVILPGTRVVFEDKLPGANWGHPAVYKVVGPSGQTLEQVEAFFPPADLGQSPIIDGVLPEANSRVEFKLNDFGGQYKVKSPSRFYAVFINGAADKRHWNDFSFLYRTLTQIYGYDKKNIIVMDGNFKESAPDLDGDGTPDIMYDSKLATVKDVLTKLKSQLKPEDQLVLAVNDHGDTQNGESTIVLQDGEIKASEFAPLFKDLPASRVLTIYEQCFSGGFVRPSISETRVSMAGATNQEFSWASQDLNFDEFIYHVVAAFARQTHDGKPLNTDLNRDGNVSAQEAFAYAIANDSRPESPLLESSVNAGLAAKIGLGF